LASSPGALPGHYLAPTAAPQPRNVKDIVSRGIITLENAQKYFDEYQTRLDHFIYRISRDRDALTLERAREVSPLLTAAICAVGALHLASEDFELCYKEILTLSATLSISRSHSVHDIRALCIAAFWLSDLAWPLIGIAVRISAELQLHKSLFRSLLGDWEHYCNTRLYLFVYTVDHHFSVAYGRPPMTRECETVRNAKRLLECEHATEDDRRLVSQVLRWSVCSNIFDTFGSDADRPLSDTEIPHVRQFSIALDSLHAEWADVFGSNSNIGNYPSKGARLQYHFAKLYLFSHALRGVGSVQAKARSPDIAWELDDIANSAVVSAVSILRNVVSDTEMQSHLNGLPAYFDIMIAFAVVFLLKVSTQFSASVRLDVREIRQLMSTLLTVLKGVTATMHSHHLLVTITKGIDGLLQRYGLPAEPAVTSASWSPSKSLDHHMMPECNIMDRDFNMENDLLNQYFMNEYDFLLGQDNRVAPGAIMWNASMNPSIPNI
jgi:hypothetical protein